MNKTIIVVIVLLSMMSTPSLSGAGLEYNVWYFGDGLGIDFNRTPTGLLIDGALNGVEASSAICDTSGKLILYSDGTAAWNASHTLINGSEGMSGCASSAQGALIIRAPGSDGLFYIFTVDCAERGGIAGLRYTEIDMRALDGAGNTVRAAIPLANEPVAEQLAAARHANGRDVWIIAHRAQGAGFLAFLVTEQGVAAEPVGSAIGIEYRRGDNIGSLSVAPNGRLVAGVIHRALEPADSLAQLLRFDNETGKLSDPIRLPLGTWGYGAAISPDNSKLYIGEQMQLIQFDLEAGTPDLIADSRTMIFERDFSDGGSGMYGALRLAPDGNIYIASDREFLGVIREPDLLGTACDYRHDGFDLGGRSSTIGLPNILIDDGRPQAHFATEDTVLCTSACADFTDQSVGAPERWEWSFPGAEPSQSSERNPTGICYPRSGVFQARLLVANASGTSEFVKDILVVDRPQVDAGADQTICIDESIRLQATPYTAGSYIWEPADGLSDPASSAPLAAPLVTTIYTVQYTDENGCTAQDAVTVHVRDSLDGRLALTSILAPPGEIGVHMPLVLELDSTVSHSEPLAFRARIRYPAHALEVTNLTRGIIVAKKIVGDDEILEIEVSDVLIDDIQTILTEFVLRTFHTGGEQPFIQLTEFAWIDGDVCIAIGDGSGRIQVAGQCLAYRLRLAPLPAFSIDVAQTAPGELVLLLGSDSRSSHNVTVYNSFGAEVYSIDIPFDHSRDQTLRRAVRLESARLAAGAYFVVVRSAEHIASQPFLIVK